MQASLKALRATPLAGAIALSLALAAPAHAANFFFSAGFVGSNPNTGTWTYVERDAGGQETILSNLAVLPYGGSSCYIAPCWTPMWNDPTQRNSVPSFFSNNTNSDWQSYGSCCQAVVLPKRCLIVHPGNLQKAVVRFTVPPKADGSSYTKASLRGTITDQDYNGGNGVNWWVEVGTPQNVIGGGSLISTQANALGSAALPSQSVAVSTGTVINLVVDANGGDENFDSTAVCGKIVLN